MDDEINCDDESFKEKVKSGAGVATLIGSGILSVLHILSHIIPAVGILGLSFLSENSIFYRIVSSEYMQIAYVGFVALSFYYIYRDHRHHKHEKELRRKISELERELEKANRLKKI